MTYRDQHQDLAVHYETHGFALPEPVKRGFDEDLDRLATILQRGPSAHLHVDVVHHARSNDYHVKTSLRIGRNLTFFTGDRDALPRPAFKRCVHKLIHKVEAFRRRREGVQPRVRDVAPHVSATSEPAWDRLAQAALDGDYAGFRAELAVYEPSLEQRIGREVERFPTAAAALGNELLISEIVEEVFLNAFDRFAQDARKDVPLSQWLESLIAPSIRQLLEAPDTAKENVSFAQTLIGR
jgi:hypothetical protein